MKTSEERNRLVAVAVICLAIGAAAGLSANPGYPDRRAGEASCGDADDGCPMMRGGGMMGAHQMPDGSMMMSMGGSGDMGSMMMDMTARLEGKTGDALDKVFLEDMIVHHQGAVDMAKLLAAGSNRAEMQKFAADIIRVQSAEISQMEAWEKSWFGN